jgi:hypothetical protein
MTFLLYHTQSFNDNNREEREREKNSKPIGQATVKKRRRIRRTWSKKIYIKATNNHYPRVISFFKFGETHVCAIARESIRIFSVNKRKKRQFRD